MLITRDLVIRVSDTYRQDKFDIDAQKSKDSMKNQ